MDEFFFDHQEHQALAEPMVVECARSAPVVADRPALKLVWIAPRPVAAAPRAPHFIFPQRTGPPLAA